MINRQITQEDIENNFEKFQQEFANNIDPKLSQLFFQNLSDLIAQTDLKEEDIKYIKTKLAKLRLFLADIQQSLENKSVALLTKKQNISKYLENHYYPGRGRKPYGI